MSEKSHYYKEETFSKWSDFRSFIDKSRLEWIYRGQGNSQWDISTSLERFGFDGPIERIDSIEHQILEEFKRAAKHYLPPKHIPTTLVEWLGLIQHYGSPSRLIDFTRSPYIAAYFAFENEKDLSEHATIWIVNCVAFYQRSIYYLEKKGVEGKYLRQQFSTEPYVFSDLLLKEIFDKQQLDCVIPIGTYSMNKRYLLQQSVFLSPCNPQKSFFNQLDFLDENIQDAIIKVNLSTTLRNEALRDLNKMNITRVSLFPGLDGFAKALNMQYSTFTNMY